MARRIRKTKVSVLERKIYFYRYRYKEEDTGPEFIPRTVARFIDQLNFDDGERYLDLSEGNSLCVWADSTSDVVKLRLGMVRRSGLPEVENIGSLSPLSIPVTAGLLEPVHVVFFPNCIVGVEFNFYGPRMSRLSSYIQNKCSTVTRPVYFDLLLRRDIQEQLQNMGDIRMFQLRLHRSYFDLAQEADNSLGAAFKAAEESSEATTIEILLRNQRYSHEPLPQKVFGWIKKLAELPRIREGAEVFKVRARNELTDRVEEFDLLKDQLVAVRQVLKQDERLRAIRPDSMYRAIESAYKDLKESLEMAAGIESEEASN